MTDHIIRAVVVAAGAFLLWCGTVAAEPMKCSGEHQTCITSCAQLTDPTRLKACVSSCSQRQAACRQTGCWNNGRSTYCGLMRQ
jgi:hypothetical protein